MIIEMVKIDEGKALFFIHHKPGEDKASDVRAVGAWLKDLHGLNVIALANGQPCPTNPMPKVTLVNGDNDRLMSVILKAVKARPGEVIPLSEADLEAYVEAQKNGEMVYL